MNRIKINLLLLSHPESGYSMTKTSSLIKLCFKELGNNFIPCTPLNIITSRLTNPKIKKYTRYFELHFIFSLKLIYLRLRYSIQDVFLVDHSDAIHLFFLPKNKAVSIVHDQFAYLASKNKIPGVKIGILGRVYQLLIHQGLLRSRKLLPVSEYTKKILTELDVKSTMEVLCLTWNPWHDESSEISKMHVLPKKYALLVSPSSWRKNRVQAFNVMIEIRKTKELENLELIVIGDPISESESAIFNKSEIGFINFKQNISEIDLKKIYDHAIFCLVISKYEGFGLPILEANSRGIRCLHNQLPSFMEITNLENIILEDKTDSNNWISIANSINQFVASRSLSIETASRFGYDVFLRNLKNQLSS